MAALPKLGGESEFFWTSGQDGRLRFLRCQQCGYYNHPPTTRCPWCLSAELQPEVIAGVGEVLSFTFVAGDPGVAEQTVVAWVGFPEQDDLRITATLVGVSPPDAVIGMPVKVAFEVHGDVYLPVFTPI